MKIATLLLIGAISIAEAAPIITLEPSASISGAPGATIGWGFEIINDTAQWLVVSSVTPSGFSPAVGTFTDFIAAQNFYVVSPNSIELVGFSTLVNGGFGSFLIDSGATPGAVTNGTFAVLYDLYTNNPNIDPSQVSPGNAFGELSASVSVARDTQGIPEPGQGILVALALGGLTLLRRR